MRNKPVKGNLLEEKTTKEKALLPLEVHTILTYLKDCGVSGDKIKRVLGLWGAWLDRKGGLLDELERAYRLRQERLARLNEAPGDADFYEELRKTTRRIVNQRAQLDLEDQEIWIALAEESGRPEVTRGLSEIRRIVTKGKVAAHDLLTANNILYSARGRLKKNGDVLKRLRKDRGMTLQEVAERSDYLYPMTKEVQITVPHLNRAEHGTTVLSTLKLMVLSQVYNIPFDLFLSLLGLDDLRPLIKEIARDLMLSIYRDLYDAKDDRRMKVEEELAELEDHYDRLDRLFSEQRHEKESLKRQVEFLESEVRTLRAGVSKRSVAGP